MASLKEAAQAYEPKKTKNIAELPEVPVNIDIHEGTGIDKDGKEFTYSFVTFDGDDYRVPNSVLEALKTIIEERKDLRTFKVSKKGEGMNTRYTVIPLV